MIIAIDFDGTIVKHEFPYIGDPVPGAIEWMKKFQDAGAKLILWTMRSNYGRNGDTRRTLTEAVDYCYTNGIKFWAINNNPEQVAWTASAKAFANVYIDDAAFGCPIISMPDASGEHGRPWVNWAIVGPAIMEILEANNGRR